MKICMGTLVSYEPVNTVQPTYGFPFVVQEDKTLMCEVTGKMAEVASHALKAGQIELWYPPKTDKAEIEKDEQAAAAKAEIDSRSPTDEPAAKSSHLFTAKPKPAAKAGRPKSKPAVKPAPKEKAAANKGAVE